MLYDYIAEFDRVFINIVDYETKKKWLDRLEAELRDMLANRIPEGTETVAVFPYDEVYIEYLKMKCAELSGDTTRFNNYLSLFNDARDRLCAYYIRTYPSSDKVGWKNVL